MLALALRLEGDRDAVADKVFVERNQRQRQSSEQPNPERRGTSRCVRLRSAEGTCTRDAGVRRVADECANVLVDELMQDERAVQEVLLYRER